MRLLLVLLISFVATADSACKAVEENSFDHITCTRDDFGYTLQYDTWISRRITLMSGRYDEMIRILCVKGGVVREQWNQPFKGTQLRITHCLIGEGH